ncbi:AEC family transporter [Cellulosilyticum sp. I15G10I2]|uniref:AEC family transporter n=1 Tax=Cellulosilyticum sp. I15G10I2 TaxID=1892843 RepID=UPI00085C691A|nr:AEC family transporter [Cellulosilyticum sp. I15G10I2]
MEDLIFAVNVVLPLFVTIVLGYCLTKSKMWDLHFTQVGNKVCFRFFIPILLFINIYNTDVKKLFDIKLIGFAVGGVILTIILSTPLMMLLVKENNKRGVLIQAVFRSNVILFGIPIAGNIFGNEGISVATAIIAFIVPVFNLCAVIVLTVFTEGTPKNILIVLMDIIKNPLIIGSVLGVVAASIRTPIPIAIEKSLRDIAAIGAPLALLLLGAEFEIKALRKNVKYIVIAVLGKLIVAPAAILSLAVFLGFRQYELVALLAAFGAPIAVNSYIMVQQAGSDAELAGQLIVITTILAPITLCLFIYGLKMMGLIG